MQPKNVNSILAVGENFGYALFKIAFDLAANGLHIWCISPNIFETAPDNVRSPDKEILQLITFMYLKSCDDLVKHLNGIHLWRYFPDCIIVTGFEHYCDLSLPDYSPLKAALITTTLLESAAVCARKKSKVIKLLVTCSQPITSDIPKLQVLKDLYFTDFKYKENNDDFCNNIVELFK